MELVSCPMEAAVTLGSRGGKAGLGCLDGELKRSLVEVDET